MDNNDCLGKNLPKKVEKILFIVNNTCIPNIFTYHETHLLKITYSAEKIDVKSMAF